jgi:TolB-like protein
VLFVMVCTGFMSYGVVRHWNRADYDGTAVIAVLPFKVIGGTELAYLENGLVEMVSRNIDGAAGLRAIAPDMVLSYAKEKSATSPTEALAEKLAARYLVTGNVTQSGNQVRVTATLHDFKKADGDPVVVEGTTSDLFSIVDRLSARILAATRKGQDARLSQAAALTTNSLPALRKYLQGEDFYRKTHYDSAVAQFSEAVTIDSTFALAYYRQALAHANNSAFSEARVSIDKGLRNSTRLTTRDQSLMQALREFIDGRYDALPGVAAGVSGRSRSYLLARAGLLHRQRVPRAGVHGGQAARRAGGSGRPRVHVPHMNADRLRRERS